MKNALELDQSVKDLRTSVWKMYRFAILLTANGLVCCSLWFVNKIASFVRTIWLSTVDQEKLLLTVTPCLSGDDADGKCKECGQEPKPDCEPTPNCTKNIATCEIDEWTCIKIPVVCEGDSFYCESLP